MPKTNEEIVEEFAKIPFVEDGGCDGCLHNMEGMEELKLWLRSTLTLKDTQHEEEMREKLKALEAKVAERIATTFNVNTYADGNRIFTEGALAVVDIARELLTPNTPEV